MKREAMPSSSSASLLWSLRQTSLLSFFSSNPPLHNPEAAAGDHPLSLTPEPSQFLCAEATTSAGNVDASSMDVTEEALPSMQVLSSLKEEEEEEEEEEAGLPPSTPLAVFHKLKQRGSSSCKIWSLSSSESTQDRQPITEAALTEYERQREENIRRNQMFIEKLGIPSSIPNRHSLKRKPKKSASEGTTRVNPSPALPLRRSKRINPIETVEAKIEEDVSSTDNAAFLLYNDSSALKYICKQSMNDIDISCHELSSSAMCSGKSIVGFLPMHKRSPLRDAFLSRIYTMSVYYASQTHCILLAAGGHQGRIAVFGSSFHKSNGDGHLKQSNLMHSTGSTDFDDDEDEASVEDPVLLSWKASSSWICGVKFLSDQPQENALLLLSSGNDAKLVLWDINKQQQQKLHGSSRGPTADIIPFKVTEAHDIHSSGIFSMHEFEGQIATASKDSTLGISKLAAHSIMKERSISGHHTGVVRGVNFRDSATLADCGSDGLICILDMRTPEGNVMTIETGDSTGVNVVEWCPSQEHLLLSASRDPSIFLHDIRYPDAEEPLHKLSGHVHPKFQRCSHIYRPAFVGGDEHAVVTPGQGSVCLTLYSASTGKMISRGELGYDPTMVMWSSPPSNHPFAAPSLWVASRNVSQLIPTWQN